jgi:spore coat polysaccharide biosynthesis protein SpsF (cytidylyltransferase family)
MKVLAIIQARLGSERLANKVLLQIPQDSGVSMLEMVIRKTLLAVMVDKVVVVTPDKKLAEIVDVIFPNITCYVKNWEGRDVLREFYDAAKYELLDQDDIVVRITADCPLIQSAEIDRCVTALLADRTADIVYNTNESKGQLNGEGSDVEAFCYSSLELAAGRAKAGKDREHVTLWMRRNLNAVFVPCRKLGIMSVNTQKEYEKVCNMIRNKS